MSEITCFGDVIISRYVHHGMFILHHIIIMTGDQGDHDQVRLTYPSLQSREHCQQRTSYPGPRQSSMPSWKVQAQEGIYFTVVNRPYNSDFEYFLTKMYKQRQQGTPFRK